MTHIPTGSSSRARVGRFARGITILLATAAAAVASAWAVTAAIKQTPETAAPVARQAALPPCHDAVGFTSDGTRTCRARTAVVTTSAGKAPVRLENIEVTLLGTSARRTPSNTVVVDARVAVRNLLTRPAKVNTSGHQLYLSAGGQIFWGPQRGYRVALGAGDTSRHRLRFTLPATVAQRLWKADGRADLGVRPFRTAHTDGPRQLGVLQLRLQRPGEAR